MKRTRKNLAIVNDLLGRRFGKLKVLDDAPPHIKPNGAAATYWLVRCDCGKTYEAAAISLTHGGAERCKDCARVWLRRYHRARAFKWPSGERTTQVAARLKVSPWTLSERLRNGATPEEAVKPSDHGFVYVHGERVRLRDLLRKTGISRQGYAERLRLGWTPEVAATAPRGSKRA